MATTVCGCEENLEVLEDGRLCVKHDDMLVDGVNGLTTAQSVFHDGDADTNNVDTPIGASETQVSGTVTASLTNPSTSRSMLIEIKTQDMVGLDVGDSDKVYLYQRTSDNGGATVLRQTGYWPAVATGAQQPVVGDHHQRSRYVTLAPGGTYTVAFNVSVDVVNGVGTTVCVTAAIQIDMVGWLI